eukprot:evm.model.scf_430.9 EVM.evm.TU.scf_430.9   scf_430:64815-74097(+)
MARYASLHADKPDILEMPISFEFGRSRHPTGVLRISITGTLLRGLTPDDAMTETSVSAVSTASHQHVSEQDLAGFEPSDMPFDRSSPNLQTERSPVYPGERSPLFPAERSPGFQTEPDRPLTPTGQQQKPHLVSAPSTISNTSMTAQTAESCSINSRRSPDSDWSFECDKLVTEVSDLKEALAKAQAEKDELRAACQTAVEHEDELHAQLEELRQSQADAHSGGEEEEEDAEVQYLRDQVQALEAERATWEQKLAEAERLRLADEASKEKGMTKGMTCESGSDWEFHVQSTDDPQCAFIPIPKMPNQTQAERDDLKRQLEVSEKTIQSLEHQHKDVHNRLMELTNERDDLKERLETKEKEVSEVVHLRAELKALEEEISEAKRAAGEPSRTLSDMQQLAKALGEAEETIAGMVAPGEVEQALVTGLLSTRKHLAEVETERCALSARLTEAKHGEDELLEARKEKDEIAKELSIRIQEATKAEEWVQETQRTLRASEDQLTTALSRIEELEANVAKNDVNMNRVIREKEMLLEDVTSAERTARELEQDLSERVDSYNKMEERLREVTAELAIADKTVKRLESEMGDTLAEMNEATQRAVRMEAMCADLEANGKEQTSETLKKVRMLDEALAVVMTQKRELEEKASDSETVANKLRDKVSMLEDSLQESQEKGKACERELKELLAAAEQECELAQQHLSEARDGYGAVEARLLETSHSLTASEAKLIEATEKLTATEGKVHEVHEEKSALEQRLVAIDRRVHELEESSELSSARTKQLEEELAAVKSEKRAAQQRVQELELSRQGLMGKVASLQEDLQDDHDTAIAALEEKWSSIVAELESENANLRKREASLNDSLTSAKGEVDKVTKTLGQRVRKLEAEAGENVSKLGRLEVEREDLGSQVQELQKQVVQLKLERDDAKEDRADAGSELQRLREGAEALQVAAKGQQDFAKDLKNARAAVTELESEKQWLREQNRQLTERMGEAQFKVTDLEELVQEAEEERKELMAEVASARARLRDLSKLEAAFGNLQDEAKALRDENAMYQENNQRLKEEVTAAAATTIQDNDSLQTELSHLRSSTDELTLEITDLRAQNVSLKAEVDAIKAASATAAQATARAAIVERETSGLRKLVCNLERERDGLREELDARSAALEEATSRVQSLLISNNKLEGVMALKLETLEDLEVARARLQDGAPPKGRVARGLAIYEGARGGNTGEAEVLRKRVASVQAKTKEASERAEQEAERAKQEGERAQREAERAKREADEREVLVRQKKDLEMALEEMSAKNARLQEAAHTLLVKMERQYSGDQEPDVVEEIDRVMHDLVRSKMELAQLKEECVVLRKELYKSRENGIEMAAKITKLEAVHHERVAVTKAHTWTDLRLDDDGGPEAQGGLDARRSSG